MDLKLIILNEKHHDFILTCFENQNTPMHKALFPELIVGVADKDESIILGGCFLYTELKNSVAYMTWFFSNPSATSYNRGKGIDFLFKQMPALANQLGKLSLSAACHPMFEKFLKRHDYIMEHNLITGTKILEGNK